MIMLTEVYKKGSKLLNETEFSLREILVNPNNVLIVREDEKTEGDFRNGRLPADLDERQKFTKIHLNSLNNNSITVVGDMVSVCKRLMG